MHITPVGLSPSHESHESCRAVQTLNALGAKPKARGRGITAIGLDTHEDRQINQIDETKSRKMARLDEVVVDAYQRETNLDDWLWLARSHSIPT